jgi:hypothetical protein
MGSFRFEAHENVVTKHHLGKKLHWSQAARWAFINNLGRKDVAVCHVRQIDADTVEIVKRKDQNLGLAFRYLGVDQSGLYERVIINRKEKTVAVDRMDGNWWHESPFIGRRDFFYIENRDGTSHADGQLTFVRHDFWMSKLMKFQN